MRLMPDESTSLPRQVAAGATVTEVALDVPAMEAGMLKIQLRTHPRVAKAVLVAPDGAAREFETPELIVQPRR